MEKIVALSVFENVVIFVHLFNYIYFVNWHMNAIVTNIREKNYMLSYTCNETHNVLIDILVLCRVLCILVC